MKADVYIMILHSKYSLFDSIREDVYMCTLGCVVQ